jgi:hypothetical protein
MTSAPELCRAGRLDHCFGDGDLALRGLALIFALGIGQILLPVPELLLGRLTVDLGDPGMACSASTVQRDGVTSAKPPATKIRSMT